MKSWKLQQLEKDLVKIFNHTLISGEIQEIVNLVVAIVKVVELVLVLVCGAFGARGVVEGARKYNNEHKVTQ
ncbi:hypothetical protein ACA351_09815 [Orientia tsutsugamushi]|uniref:hypothetical protein n=1 Tax=Orientia tsutsugamushi TaxID=784 RepID=UPI003528B078